MSEQPRPPSDDDPPFSRIFVVCSRDNTEQQLIDTFSRVGNIQYCKLVRDRATNESKGIAYIKYPLASLAALAIETFNHTLLSEDGAPLKVVLAEAKGAPPSRATPRDPEDTPPRSRLYVVCPKGMTEEELSSIFRPFGDMEYCRLLREKVTQQSKGCAYVKYSRSSSAMKALETIQAMPDIRSTVRVVVAEPKSAGGGGGGGGSPRFPEYPRIGGGSPLVVTPAAAAPMMSPAVTAAVSPPSGMQREALVAQLALLTKGLMDQYPPGQVPQQLQQFSAQLLQTPLDQPPLGNVALLSAQAMSDPDPPARLYVATSKSVTEDFLTRLFGQFPGMEYVELKRDRLTGESKGFAFIGFRTTSTATLARGLLDGTEFPPGSGHAIKVVFAEPPRTPVAAEATPRDPNQIPPGTDGSRLFAVLTRPTPSEGALYEVFNQFPGLEYVRIQPGKNYGYVKYGTTASASHALYYLNGAEMANGSKITLKVADPPPSARPPPGLAGEFEARKRQRT